MKKTKRIFAIFMTLTLAMSMLIASSAMSFAADAPTYSITIQKDDTDKAAHTYGAYQLFKGEIDGNQLTKIQWGDGITHSAAFITAINTALELTGDKALPADATATAVARAINDFKYSDDTGIADDDAKAQALADVFSAYLGTATKTVTVAAADKTGTLSELPAGYYLVKDTTAVTGEGASTRFILKLTKDATVTLAEKADVPSVTKKVKEKNDTTGIESGWQDAADWDIGDSIPYKLEGTLPTKFAEFDTYKTYTFVDTLTEGLTPPAAKDVKITLNSETGTDLSSLFNVTIAEQVITVSLKENIDLKTAKVGSPETGLKATDKILVTYNAVLNDKAKLGSQGNPNEVYLEFSNNPNVGGDGDHGTTPPDKVIVFTYEIKALKIAPTSDAAITQAEYDAITDATEKAKYVKIGEKWQKTAPLAGAGFTLYKKVPAGTEGAEDGYIAVKELKGDTLTEFEFKGVDAGEYKLVETTVPAGYTKAEDILLTVTATYDTDSADPKLTSLTVTPVTAGFTVNVTENKDAEGTVTSITTDGVISGKVLNKDGAVLPATGGIGTIIFYVLGTLLVVGCGVVLISKKRMENK